MTAASLLGWSTNRASAKQTQSYDVGLSDPGSPPTTSIQEHLPYGLKCTEPNPKESGDWSYVLANPVTLESPFTMIGESDKDKYEFKWTSKLVYKCIHAKAHLLGEDFTKIVRQTCFILQFEYEIKLEFLEYTNTTRSLTGQANETAATRTKFESLVASSSYKKSKFERKLRNYCSLATVETVENGITKRKITHCIKPTDGKYNFPKKDDIESSWLWVIDDKSKPSNPKLVGAKVTVKPLDDLNTEFKGIVKSLLIDRGKDDPDMTKYKKPPGFTESPSETFKFVVDSPADENGYDCPAMIDGNDLPNLHDEEPD
ncbi:MAG: hypothetical protein ABF384_18430 [Verrucomicrobiales bacterium]